MKAMIFAAGLGTRLRPYTEDRPKALVQIGGMPLLEIAIRRLAQYGFDQVVLNVHHHADLVEQWLRKHPHLPAELQVSDERGELLETGGGLKRAAPMLRGDGPVLVMNVDVLTDLDLGKLYAEHQKSGALATLAVRQRDTSRYLLFDDAMRLSGWKNQRTGEQRLSRGDAGSLEPWAFSGIQVLSPEFFDLLEEDGRFSIIEPYLRLAKDHLLQGYAHNEGYWIDVGKPESLDEARKILPAVLKFTEKGGN